jgi:hypothetical protein
MLNAVVPSRRSTAAGLADWTTYEENLSARRGQNSLYAFRVSGIAFTVGSRVKALVSKTSALVMSKRVSDEL